MFPRTSHVFRRVPLALIGLFTIFILTILALPTPSSEADTPSTDQTANTVQRDVPGETRSVQEGDQIQILPSRARLMEQIELILEAQREDIAQLRASFDKSATPEEALAVQRRIEERKLKAEISIYAAQIVYLREIGRQDAAMKLEQVVQQLRDPESASRSTEVPSDDSQN